MSEETKLTEEQKLLAVMAAIIRVQTGNNTEGDAVKSAKAILKEVKK